MKTLIQGLNESELKSLTQSFFQQLEELSNCNDILN